MKSPLNQIDLPEQLSALYGWAMNEEQGGASRYPGMTYEDGIKAVINWLEGDAERPDLEE